MKKIILIVLCCASAGSIFSQSREAQFSALEDLKSGNHLDAFTSFYQLAFKSISVNEKSLDLNATLFSLVKNYDENLLHSQSRGTIAFLRNFQVNGKANLTESLDFNGYSAGFTYAILNERDKGFIDIEGTPFVRDINALDILIDRAMGTVVVNEITAFETQAGREITEEEMKDLSDKLTIVATALHTGKTVDSSLLAYHSNYVAELDNLIANSGYFQMVRNKDGAVLSSTALVNSYIRGEKDAFLKDLEKKPFLSLAADGISDKNGKLNQMSANLVFLMGSHFGEVDVRAKYHYADTLEVSMPRDVFNGKIGYNFKVARNKNKEKSIFEIKAYGEYNKIMKNALPDEDDETILVNADFRIRLTDDLWIPITVKYDTETANFLGFLNVTYNFGGFD